MKLDETAVVRSPDELSLVIEALDSHEYWQLTEPENRSDGYSMVEDGENAEIDAVRELMAELGRATSSVPT